MLTGATLLFAGQDVDWDSLSADEQSELLRTDRHRRGRHAVPGSGSAGMLVTTMDVTTLTVRSAATFDGSGRLDGYQETTTSSGPNLNLTQTWSGRG